MKYIQYRKFSLIRIFLTSLFLTLLSACSTLPNNPNRLPASLEQLSEWEARGKIMLSEGKEKNSGYFLWQQQGDEFRFKISTFIGTSVFSMSYKDGDSELEVDGKSYQGQNPDLLLYRVTGQSIPISQLGDWLLSIPVEGMELASYDQQGLLSKFNYQIEGGDNWNLHYRSRMMIAKFELPQSINLKSTDKRIKISVSDWQLIK